MDEIVLGTPDESGEKLEYTRIDMADRPAFNKPCQPGDHRYVRDFSDDTENFYSEVCKNGNCKLGRLVRR